MIRNRSILIPNQTEIRYLDKYKVPFNKPMDLCCKICGKELEIVKRRNKCFFSIKSCPCQSKKGNLKYLESVFGEKTDLSKKYWEDYKKSTYKKEPLLLKMIRKHGEDKGREKYKSFLEKCDQSLKGFIKRYGEKNGLQRYEKFKERSLNTKEQMIKKYGPDEGIKRYHNMIEKMKKISKFSFAYWLNFFNGDFELASEAYTKFQKKDLFYFISRYGDEEGTKRYENLISIRKKQNTIDYRKEKHGKINGVIKWREECSKKSITKDYYLNKYGKDVGEKEWEKLCRSKVHTLENYVKKFGVDEGLSKYKKYKKSLLNHLRKQSTKSSFQLSFIEEIIKLGGFDEKDFMFDESEMYLYDFNENKYNFFDLCMPSNNKIIEINGDFWHANPKIYSESYYHPLVKKQAKDIWEKDKRKIRLAEDSGYSILVVWEKDIRYNRFPEIEKCIKFLKEESVIYGN